MEVYVYELLDQVGKVVDVGVSIRPKSRFRNHIGSKPGGNGRWYGRTDLTWQIHSSHNTRKEARLVEGARKLEVGLDWTEYKCHSAGGKIGGKIGGRKNVESGHLASLRTQENQSNAGKIGGKVSSAIIRTCPHCNKTCKGNRYFQIHGDRCKLKPISKN